VIHSHRRKHAAATAQRRLVLSLKHLLFLACLAASLSAKAQQPVSPLPLGYVRDVWRVSDGLPEDTVQALAEGPGGRLWIGSTGGLATLDGAHIQIVSLGLAQQIGANSVFCIAFSHDGTVWAGTEGGGLLHITRSSSGAFNSSSTKVLFTESGLADGFVRSLLEDSHSQLWVGTDNGLFRLTGTNHLQRVDGTAAIPALAVHSIMEGHDGRLWVGGSKLIAISRDGTSQTFALPGAYSASRVKKIVQAADGTLWVGTVGGLARLVDGRFESVPGIHATVRSLLQTRDGTLWIGTIGDGLWMLRHGHLQKVSDAGLLPSSTILSIFEDSYQQVWIGTQVGLVRLSQTPVRMVTLPDPRDSDFESLSGDSKGKIYVAAQSLFTITDGVARRTDLGLPGTTVRNVFPAQDGTLWVGTDGSGVFRLRNNQQTHFSAPQQLTNNFIRAFMESRRHELWIATDEGVSVLTPHGDLKFTESSGLAYFSTRCLLEDRRGIIWIGTDRGLSAVQNGVFKQNAATQALAREKVWSILEDKQGALWFGTRDHGLFRWQNGSLQQYTVETGLPSNSIYQLLQSGDGTFWITGPNMIASVPETDMDAPWDASRLLSVTVYSMPYGAEGAQLYGGRAPAGYLAPDQTVWFPTNRGVAHVTPQAAPTTGPPPRPVLNAVEEDGRIVNPADTLEVPANIHRLTFDFSAVYLRPQTQLHFRYMLEGFDRSWINTNSQINGTGQDKATYTNLRAGHYTFRVQAYDSARPQALEEAAIHLQQTSHFYQTPWFYTLCAVFLLLVGLAIYRLRVRRLHGRFKAVMEERGRLAREMHDTVIQSCTGVSALLEAIASTQNGAVEMNAELLGLARQQTRQTIETARQVVWNIRHQNENDVEIVAAIHASVDQLVRDGGIDLTVDVQGLEALSLPSSIAHELLMTVREAVYNAVQHSGSRRVDIVVRRRQGNLDVHVEDTGTGIPPGMLIKPPNGHYGIIGMRERMRKVHGDFDIASTVGAGTTVRVRIPLLQRSNKFTEQI
jgi:signal transduction histidine kinase/ligand-binding sensor domain-containing protein